MQLFVIFLDEIHTERNDANNIRGINVTMKRIMNIMPKFMHILIDHSVRCTDSARTILNKV